MYSQRYQIAPHEGYTALLNLLKEKDHFIWTSNVDGWFAKYVLISACVKLELCNYSISCSSGFDAEKIYKPQGDWEWLQCSTPCSHQVWPSKPILESVLPFIKDCEFIDPSKIPMYDLQSTRSGV